MGLLETERGGALANWKCGLDSSGLSDGCISMLQCPQNHMLQLAAADWTGSCDSCSRRIALNERVWQCEACNWWCCLGCYTKNVNKLPSQQVPQGSLLRGLSPAGGAVVVTKDTTSFCSVGRLPMLSKTHSGSPLSPTPTSMPMQGSPRQLASSLPRMRSSGGWISDPFEVRQATSTPQVMRSPVVRAPSPRQVGAVTPPPHSGGQEPGRGDILCGEPRNDTCTDVSSFLLKENAVRRRDITSLRQQVQRLKQTLHAMQEEPHEGTPRPPSSTGTSQATDLRRVDHDMPSGPVFMDGRSDNSADLSPGFAKEMFSANAVLKSENDALRDDLLELQEQLSSLQVTRREAYSSTSTTCAPADNSGLRAEALHLNDSADSDDSNDSVTDALRGLGKHGVDEAQAKCQLRDPPRGTNGDPQLRREYVAARSEMKGMRDELAELKHHVAGLRHLELFPADLTPPVPSGCNGASTPRLGGVGWPDATPVASSRQVLPMVEAPLVQPSTPVMVLRTSTPSMQAHRAHGSLAAPSTPVAPAPKVLRAPAAGFCATPSTPMAMMHVGFAGPNNGVATPGVPMLFVLPGSPPAASVHQSVQPRLPHSARAQIFARQFAGQTSQTADFEPGMRVKRSGSQCTLTRNG